MSAADVGRLARETQHAFWERAAAHTRHEIGVMARLIPGASPPRLRLVIGCRCGWELDDGSTSPRRDVRDHLGLA